MATNTFLRLENGRPVADVELDSANIPTGNEKEGLGGSHGIPSSSNKFILETHTTLPTVDQADAVVGVDGFPPSSVDVLATEDYVTDQISIYGNSRNWLNNVEETIDYVKTTSGAPPGTPGYLDGEILLNLADGARYVASSGEMVLDSINVGERFLFNESGEITTEGANGVSATPTMKIYTFNGSTFDEYTPQKADTVLSLSDNDKFTFDGTFWEFLESPFSHNETLNLVGGNGVDEFFHVTTDQEDGLDSSLSSSNFVISVGDKNLAPAGGYGFCYRGGYPANTTTVVFDLTGSDTKEVLPRSGSVILAAVEIPGGAPTAGQLTITVQTDESDSLLTTTINSSTTNNIEVESGVVDFSESIGVKFETDASWDQTTSDIVVYLYIILDE